MAAAVSWLGLGILEGVDARGWAMFNALLVGLDFFIIAYGVYLAKVKRDFRTHPRVMITAGVVFALFLVSFLLKVGTHGIQVFPTWDASPWGIQPKHILIVHETVALLTVPLIIAAYWFAYKKDFLHHRRVVRYAWPLWLFESAFGIAEFFILYYG